MRPVFFKNDPILDSVFWSGSSAFRGGRPGRVLGLSVTALAWLTFSWVGASAAADDVARTLEVDSDETGLFDRGVSVGGAVIG